MKKYNEEEDYDEEYDIRYKIIKAIGIGYFILVTIMTIIGIIGGIALMFEG